MTSGGLKAHKKGPAFLRRAKDSVKNSASKNHRAVLKGRPNRAVHLVMDFIMLTKAPGPSFPDFQDRDSYRGSGISVDRAHQALANLGSCAKRPMPSSL